MKRWALALLLLIAAQGVDGLATASLGLMPGAARAAAIAWLLLLPLWGLAAGYWAFQGWSRSAPRERGGRLLVFGLLLAGLWVSQRELQPWSLLHPGSGLQIESLEDGRVLRLQGPMAGGDGARLQPLLAAVRRIELASSGGAPSEALGLAAVLRARPELSLLLRGDCERDCVLVFLAAPSRVALHGAALGLQRLAAPSWNPLWQRWLDARLAPLLEALPPVLQQRRRYTPSPRLSRVEGVELQALLGRPSNALALLIPAAPASHSDWRLALDTHPVWPLLEQRQPGRLESLASALQAADPARAEGLAREALDLQAQRLRAGASALLQVQALELLDAQLQALTEDAACSRLPAQVPREQLPAALVMRELEWLRDAAHERLAEPARALKPLEQEVLRIALGAARSRQLERLLAGQQDCAGARQIVADLLALAPAQRRLAAKRVFLLAA